jgi:type IV pilus assembly protein PilA
MERMTDRKAYRSSGWRTLAWLMMFVILGVPTEIARRAYQSMVLRSQAAEGVALAVRSKQAVEAFYAGNHAFPADSRQAGLTAPIIGNGKFVSSVAIEDGKVVVTYGNAADVRIAGQRLVFFPRPEGNGLAWSCASAAGTNLEMRARPSRCRQ